jgi:hypothetical protein
MAIAKQPAIKSGLMNQPLPVLDDKPKISKQDINSNLPLMLGNDDKLKRYVLIQQLINELIKD